MRHILFLLTISMLVFSSSISAQSPTGSVLGLVRGGDGKLQEAATVSLYQSADSALAKMAVTNKEGRFLLENLAPGNYFVAVSKIGFELFHSDAFVLTAGENGKELPAIELIQVAKDISGVTVTARKPLIEQKIDRTVVNVDASITNAGNTALEVLEKAPGVSIDKDGNISLKGKEGVVVYIDGRPSYLSGADLANLLRSMNGSQLDQIEIMTNPPAKYDAAGNSGIINIKTKKTKQFGYSGSFTTGYTQGRYARLNDAFNMNYRTGKVNLFTNLNYNRNKTGSELEIARVFRNPVTGDVSSRFEQVSWMRNSGHFLNGKLGADYYVSNKTTIGATISGYYNPSDWYSKTPSYIFSPAKDTISVTQAISKNKEEWTNFSANLNFRTVLDSSGQELTGDIDYIQYLSTNSQPLYSAYFDKHGQPISASDTLLGTLPQDIFIYSGKLDYTLPLKDGAKFEAGWKSSYVETDNNALYENIYGGVAELDSARTNHFVYRENINAAYANYSRSLGKKWDAQLGLRVENTNARGVSRGYEFDTNNDKFVATERRFKRAYTQLFPTFYLQYKASEQHQWVLNYGRRVNRPNYMDLNPFINFLDRYTFQQGNPDLKPQFAHNVELKHTYKSFLSTTLNYTRTDDIIQQVFEQNDETNETYIKKANIAKMQQVGLGVSAFKQINKIWSGNVFVNINYNEFEGLVNGTSVSVDQVTAAIQMQHQFKLNKGWSAEIGGFYRTKGLQGVMNIEDFGMLNAGFSKQVLKNKGTIRVNVRDIFAGGVFKGTSRYGDVDVRFKSINDSRALNVSFSWRFSKGKINNNGGQRKKGGADDELNRVGR
ncbi:MAG: TonB-dependent receptor [Chitinophagaceae bacterium]|nr:TonB-dependent receptor [Chitinophagaceae bacterium]